MSEFQDYLYNNDIKCDTCVFYTANTPLKNTATWFCGNKANTQSNAYHGQLLCLPKDGACHRWEKFIDPEDEV